MVSFKQLLFSWTLSLSLLDQTLADPAPKRGISAREFADLAQIYARHPKPLSTRQNRLRARIAHKRSPLPKLPHETRENTLSKRNKGAKGKAKNPRNKDRKANTIRKAKKIKKARENRKAKKNRKAKNMPSRPASPTPAPPAPASNRQNSLSDGPPLVIGHGGRAPGRFVPSLGRQGASVGTLEGNKKLTDGPNKDNWLGAQA